MVFKNFFHTLRRFYASSLLNIIGLAVAFATAYLILVQVNHDLNYNQSIPDKDRIFILEMQSNYDQSKYVSWLSRPVAEAFSKDNPAVESYGIMPTHFYQQIGIIRKGEGYEKINFNVNSVTQGGVEALGVKVIRGDLSKMSEKNAFAITESVAQRIGKDVDDEICFNPTWSPDYVGHIVAVVSDFPKNSDFAKNELFIFMGDQNLNDYAEWSFQYLVKLRSADDVDNYMSVAAHLFRQMLESQGKQNDFKDDDFTETMSKFRLLPIADSYFDKTSESGVKGNKTTTMTLLAIAVLVVVIAFINFINFFMALVPQRLRGVNTYRVYGCSLPQMRWNFVFEAIGLILLSLLLFLAVVFSVQDTFITEFFSTSILIKDNLNLVFLIIGGGLLLAVIASSYPAYYITSFPLAFAAKGGFGASKSGKRLRYTLVGIQFVISISLIVCSLFIKLQHSYMMDYEMGFNKSQLLSANVPDEIGNNFDSRETFAAELKTNPQILDVTYANGYLVTPGRMGWGRAFKGKDIYFQCYPVAYNFLDFMGVDVIEGNNFSKSDEVDTMGVFIFNQQARDEFGLTLEDLISGHVGNTRIAGFCNNFNYKPLQYKLDPFAFYVFGPNAWKSLDRLYVRTAPNANIKDVSTFIKDEIVKFVPNADKSDYEVEFFDEELGKQYQQEKKLTSMITLFSLVSIIISLMGVFGLVLFETQYRRKEIAVRRVNGATVKEILKIFNLKFVRIILICFAISVPICYYIIDKWLSGFAYRTPIYWWVFAIALIIVMVITIGIVIVRSWKTANANPIESLGNE
ncbi:MAG: ABC transporter permease [Bacteroidales bacterium]|nr:ABC transporter permease [Bacteroidales bacterium]